MSSNLAALQLASSLGSDVDKNFPQHALRSMTVRLPLSDYAFIEAIASKTSTSRGGVAHSLISAGIEAVLSALEPEKHAELLELQGSALEELIESGREG